MPEISSLLSPRAPGKTKLFRDKIEPYLGATFIEELSSQDILLWQDLIRSMRRKDGSRFSPTYFQTINNQLDAILNHAANFYRLERNLMKGLRKMGKKKAKEMSFWTKAKYLTFAKQTEADLPRIRVHDLRHNHMLLLIDLGFQALAIAERIGHSSISIIYVYVHLFPTRQHDISNALEAEEGMR